MERMRKENDYMDQIFFRLLLKRELADWRDLAWSQSTWKASAGELRSTPLYISLQHWNNTVLVSVHSAAKLKVRFT